MNRNTIIIVIVGVILIIGLGIVLQVTTTKVEEPDFGLDSFTQCLVEKKVIFYGAWWCPHCQDQKKLFGKAAKLLPYHECSTPDGNSQLPDCKELKIESYPTWQFVDGSRQDGPMTLAQLAEKTGCVLPVTSASSTPAVTGISVGTSTNPQ